MIGIDWNAFLFATYNGIALVVFFMAIFVTRYSLQLKKQNLSSWEYSASQALILWAIAFRWSWSMFFAYNKAMQQDYFWMMDTPVALICSLMAFGGFIWNFSVLTKSHGRKYAQWLTLGALVLITISYFWIGSKQ